MSIVYPEPPEYDDDIVFLDGDLVSPLELEDYAETLDEPLNKE